MVAPSTGSVMRAPFPFSDLSQSKLRAAIVLASADREDWVLCQFTSKPYGDTRALELRDAGFAVDCLARFQLCASGKTLHRPSKPFRC